MFTAPSTAPGPLVDACRDADPDRRDVGLPQLAHHLDDRPEQGFLRLQRRRALQRLLDGSLGIARVLRRSSSRRDRAR